MHRPEVILGFGPDGITGDTDHVAISRATSQAFVARGRAIGLRGRPRGGPGGLARRQALRAGGAARRSSPRWAEATPTGYGASGEAETLTLELGELSRLKLAAISRHVSQTGSAGPFHDWSAGGARRLPGDRVLPAGGLQPAGAGGRRLGRAGAVDLGRPDLGSTAPIQQRSHRSGQPLVRSKRAQPRTERMLVSRHGRSADRRKHHGRPGPGQGSGDRTRPGQPGDGQADRHQRQRGGPHRRADHAGLSAEGQDRVGHRGWAGGAGRHRRASRLGQQREALVRRPGGRPDSRGQEHHRRGVRQGRRGQDHGRGQPGGQPGARRRPGRPAGRGHHRAERAADDGHQSART